MGAVFSCHYYLPNQFYRLIPLKTLIGCYYLEKIMVWQRAGAVAVQNGSTTVVGTNVDFAASS
ncbi:hypothetical protein, partial [Pseudomonas antarctica]|uniref:hypothetical protein n=1 Tax=Pseudomonas antarctica TaxID=219572 RepID=UPI00387B617A